MVPSRDEEMVVWMNAISEYGGMIVSLFPTRQRLRGVLDRQFVWNIPLSNV